MTVRWSVLLYGFVGHEHDQVSCVCGLGSKLAIIRFCAGRLAVQWLAKHCIVGLATIMMIVSRR